MQALIRFFLVVYSLLLMAACAGLGVLAWNDNEKLDLNAGDFNLQAFVDATDSAKWAFTAILAGIGLIGLLTLLLAFSRTGMRSGGALRLRQEDGGTVEVGAQALQSLLRDELERIPDVRSADPRVRVDGNAVDSMLNLTVEPGANIAHVTNEAAHATMQTLREQIGASNVRRPSVRITYEGAGGMGAPRAPRPKPQAQPTTVVAAPSPRDDMRSEVMASEQSGTQPPLDPAPAVESPPDRERPQVTEGRPRDHD